MTCIVSKEIANIFFFPLALLCKKKKSLILFFAVLNGHLWQSYIQMCERTDKNGFASNAINDRECEVEGKTVTLSFDITWQNSW